MSEKVDIGTHNFIWSKTSQECWYWLCRVIIMPHNSKSDAENFAWLNYAC